MNCSQCNSPIQQPATFCDNCGTPVTSAAVAPTVVASGPVGSGGANCPDCGSAVIPGEAFCDDCGASLSGPLPQATPPPPFQQPAAPVPVARPQVYPPVGAVSPPAHYPPMGMQPRLVVASSGAQINFAGKAEALIGREDPISGVFPEIDMTPHDGIAGGISRKHAKLINQGNQWMIQDLNSTNYTYVNQQRLNPGRPQALNNGDEIRVGQIVLKFQTS